MSVNIRIDVDDAEVDIAIAKLKQAVSLQGQLAGGVPTRRRMRSFIKEFAAFQRMNEELIATPSLLEQFGAADLPSVNRELRLLLGQIPGARQLMQYYFRVIRLQRGVEKALGPKPDLLPITLTLLATAVILLTQAQRAHDNMTRRMRTQREEYEEFITEGLDLVQGEFESMERLQRGYATIWDQFVENSKTDFLAAADDLLTAWYEERVYTPDTRLQSGVDRPYSDFWVWLTGLMDIP